MLLPTLLVQLLVMLILIGVLLWALARLPIDPALVQVIRMVTVVFAVIWAAYVLLGISRITPYPLRP